MMDHCLNFTIRLYKSMIFLLFFFWAFITSKWFTEAQVFLSQHLVSKMAQNETELPHTAHLVFNKQQ